MSNWSRWIRSRTLVRIIEDGECTTEFHNMQVKQGAGDRGITAEYTEKSQHTDFNKCATNESANVACSNVRL